MKRSSVGPNKNTPKRKAEGFTVEATMKNVTVVGPPLMGVFRENPTISPVFRKFYQSRDFPVFLEHSATDCRIKWKVDVKTLDYHRYLPLFFDGLCETTHPYEIFARLGVHDLLNHGGAKILPVVPQLIVPIRNAMNTKVNQVMCTTIKGLQHLLVSCDKVGEALVPYFRQILPVFNLFKNKRKNLGDRVDYSERKREDIGVLINETLQMFERYGGENAFVNIKYMVPTYESCMSK